ncbi:GNAT family N-acetyltransferase [Nocardia sp. NPDC059195]|uniref:GNAT family N-acetyltransferase n=1 Tax=Nocardia sp. NPDC059195 TaxID=3346765 RepID=UPI003682E1D5
MPITTRVATTADIPACATVLAEAFRDDPLMSAIWPSPPQRDEALPKYFAASLRHFHIPGGGVQVATDADDAVGAVAVWDPPGRWDLGILRTLRAVPDLFPALRTRAPAAITIRRTLDKHHPANPEHWYLANIGTTPTLQGSGYGTRLITDRLAGLQTAAFLVCTREENITYYEKFGFRVAETFSLPAGDEPAMWAMARNM